MRLTFWLFNPIRGPETSVVGKTVVRRTRWPIFLISNRTCPSQDTQLAAAKLTAPVCNTVEKRLVARMDRRLKRLSHVACDKCSLIRQYPLPTEEDLAAYYRDFYRSDYQKTVEPTEKHIEKRQQEAGTSAGAPVNFTGTWC